VPDTVFTDANGNFTFSDLEPATYTLTAHKENFTDGLISVIVPENATSTAIFKLSRLPINLNGQWEGKISYYAANYPLLLDFEKVTSDSIYGTMSIDFSTGTVSFPIHSELYFDNDSLHFDISRNWGSCIAYDVWGSVVNNDSLQGSWKYWCVNDPSFTAPWSAHRKVK
jgi:hypothetical protein